MKKTSAPNSAGHETAARLEKKSPTALKKAEKESPSDASTHASYLGTRSGRMNAAVAAASTPAPMKPSRGSAW